MATYKQVDFVTESNKQQRGGKRDNAGRKSKHGEPTATIRLPVSLIEKIKSGSFENVTESNDIDRIAELEAKSLNCFQCVNWTDDKCSKGLTLTGWTCTDFENWQDKLKDLHREIEQQPKATGTDNGKLLYDYGLVLKDKRDCQKLLVQVQNALKNGQQFIALSLLDDNQELITRDVLNEPVEPTPAKRRSKK